MTKTILALGLMISSLASAQNLEVKAVSCIGNICVRDSVENKERNLYIVNQMFSDGRVELLDEVFLFSVDIKDIKLSKTCSELGYKSCLQ
jgi:hypothetical protein